MKWSWPIASSAGIGVKIHATFLLIAVPGAMQWSAFGLPGTAFGALLILTLFPCVTLHDFGHGLVAHRFGIPVRSAHLSVVAHRERPSFPAQSVFEQKNRHPQARVL